MAACLTHALSGASTLPQYAGKLYTVAAITSPGVFHPKLHLQVGRRGGRIIIGSANLTASGLAGNLELVSMIACAEEETGEQQLVAQAWRYAADHLPRSSGQNLAGQQEWMWARTPWLRQANPADGPVLLADGTSAALLHDRIGAGIGAQFAALVDEPVTRLLIISPYWDMQLSALSHLAQTLSPSAIGVLVDPGAAAFPRYAATTLPSVELYKRPVFGGRYLHAKAIIAQTKGADHVLIGSANCTEAALGLRELPGQNAELCLYRRLPAATILTALGLDQAFAAENRIDPADLPDAILEDDLPLQELEVRNPGNFECLVDILHWNPSAAADADSASVELLDEAGAPIACRLIPISGGTTAVRRFQIEGTAVRPSFARVRLKNGACSAPAIVTLLDRLRAVIRETQSRRAENALRILDNETEAKLALLDVLDVLQKLEREDAAAQEPLSIPKARNEKVTTSTEGKYRVLSYEQFIAGRRPRVRDGVTIPNTLAGSNLSIVRSFLNRILSLQSDDEETELTDEGAVRSALDMADETADAQAALATGAEFSAAIMPPERDTTDAEALRRHRRAVQRATREEIAEAAARFGKRIKERQADGLLETHDLLRLRALLMIICSAASVATAKELEARTEGLQALPVEGDNSWPLIIGRLLFAFFGGNEPAVRQLYLKAEHDQVPPDVIECWATCYWCFQACITAPLPLREKARIAGPLGRAAQTAYVLTLPTAAELCADDVLGVMDAMSAHYSSAMGLSATTISSSHKAFVERLLGSAAA